MKNKKYLFLPLVFALMLIFVIPTFAGTTVDIQAGTTINFDSDVEYYAFTPEKTAEYLIESQAGELDPYITVYDADYNDIDSDDDSGEEFNFSLSINLFAGKTYYLRVRNYDEGTFEFTVKLVKEHNNIVEVAAKEPTCTEDGYQSGIKCEDCGEWLTEKVILEASHKDENGDRTCEVCGDEATECTGKFNKEGTSFYKLYLNGDFVVYGEGEADYNVSDMPWYYKTKIKAIYIGKDISYIISLPQEHRNRIEKYVVDEENQYYKNDAYGALYTKDGKKLLYYPMCATATTYNIPEGVEYVEDCIFSDNEYLEKVTVPLSVKYFDANVFSEKMLEASYEEDGLIYIDNILVGVTEDENEDYFNYEGILNVNVKDGTEIIAGSSVYNRWKTAQVTLPESVKVICDYAFAVRGDSIHLPENVRYYGVRNFRYEGLVQITVDEANLWYTADRQGILYNKDKTELVCVPHSVHGKVVLPESIKSVRKYACYGARFYKGIVLNEGLEKIGYAAFCNSYVDGINFPTTLKEIGDEAFAYTQSVFVIPEYIEAVGDGAFDYCEAVFFMNPECVIGDAVYNNYDDDSGYDEWENWIVGGYTGSTAEKFADENNLRFLPLDGNHKHVYIPNYVKFETCTEDGEIVYSCPCGNSDSYSQKVETYGHRFYDDCDEDTGEGICSDCGAQGNMYEGCECRCHEWNQKKGIDKLIHKFLMFIWKLVKINDYCDCGRVHY